MALAAAVSPQRDPAAAAATTPVAYLMSRFPKLTETFVLDEILELERQGTPVEVFPLWRERATVMHEEARALVERAHYAPTLNLRIAIDNLRWLARSPGRYLGALNTLVCANLRSGRYLLAALASFPKACSFAERMRSLQVGHVHAHFASHPAACAFVVGRLTGIPWSFTAHGSDLHREQAMLPEKVAEAAFVVAISEYNREVILRHAGSEHAGKIAVVHCGVDTDSFPRAVHGADTALQLVCIGTLHEVKGQRHLVEACAGLRDQDVAFRCHLVGDGPDRAALGRRVSELGLEDRVVFHGSCDRARVRALLAGMDVAVAPSVPTADGRREGIPVALMEAGACGLALVASRLSGIPELVRDGDTGLLVDPGDVAGLGAAIARLAADPALRARLGRAARGHLETSFSLSRNVARLRGYMQHEAAP